MKRAERQIPLPEKRTIRATSSGVCAESVVLSCKLFARLFRGLIGLITRAMRANPLHQKGFNACMLHGSGATPHTA
jgi:hypothetical protein